MRLVQSILMTSVIQYVCTTEAKSYSNNKNVNSSENEKYENSIEYCNGESFRLHPSEENSRRRLAAPTILGFQFGNQAGSSTRQSRASKSVVVRGAASIGHRSNAWHFELERAI